LRDSFKKDMQLVLHANRTAVEAGLVAVYSDAQRHNGDDLITGSDTLQVMLSAGKRWFSDRQHLFVSRFKRVETVTEWFLVEPGGQVAEMLTKKEQTASQKSRPVSESVQEATEQILKAYADCGGVGILRIYYLPEPYFPVHSLYLGMSKDERLGTVVVTPYRASGHRGPSVPAFVFSGGEAPQEIFTFYRDDMARLRKQCKLHADLPHHAPELKPAAT
jgi:hypothetical protein